MKICPQCQSTYTDDSLQYCLQDGSPLGDLSPAATTDDWAGSETLVSPARREKMRVDVPPSTVARTGETEPETPTVHLPAKRSSPLLFGLAAIGGLFLLIAAGGLGGWLYFRSRQPEPAGNVNVRAADKLSPSPANTNPRNVADTATPSPSPAETPAPRPTLRAAEAEEIERDVGDVIDQWKDATEDSDIAAQMDAYADAVDYYNAGRIGAGAVRADKERAFGIYDSIEIDISDLDVTLDESGENAVAVFDKEWNFEGAENHSSGKVQQQLRLSKINGRWLITGEKDLKVYYVNR